MSLSNITVSGTVKKAPDKRFTPSNIPVANFLLEICFIPRGSQATQESISSQMVRVNAWRDLAERIENELKAGDKVLINGRAQMNVYTNNEGKKKRELEIDATSITLLNNVLSLVPPVKKEEQETVKQISNVDELVASTEEIPF